MCLCLLNDQRCPTTLMYMPSQHDARSNWFGVSWKGEGGKEGGMEGGNEGGGREGRREGGCRLCVIVLHIMPFEIDVI